MTRSGNWKGVKFKMIKYVYCLYKQFHGWAWILQADDWDVIGSNYDANESFKKIISILRGVLRYGLLKKIILIF